MVGEHRIEVNTNPMLANSWRYLLLEPYRVKVLKDGREGTVVEDVPNIINDILDDVGRMVRFDDGEEGYYSDEELQRL